MSMIQRFLGRQRETTGKPREESEEFYRQKSKERMEKWNSEAETLYYCELCNQVFVSFDVFYDHRMASDSERARGGDGEFGDYRELQSGDEFPEAATVGELEPCTPVKERETA